MEEYPYFIYPVIRELEKAPEGSDTRRLRQIVAANVGDRDALVALIGNAGTDLRTFYLSGRKTTPSSADAIDSFISKFGGDTILPPTQYQFEEPEDPVIPAPEHPNIPIPEDPNNPASEHPNITIPEHPNIHAPEQKDPMEQVKNLVKNREYESALAIMEDFYLNNPKKSVYFADQIRFVRKLMLNESRKSR